MHCFATFFTGGNLLPEHQLQIINGIYRFLKIENKLYNLTYENINT